MNTVNFVMLVVFVAVIVLALFAQVLLTMLRERPAHRLRARLMSVSDRALSSARAKILQDLQRAQHEARRRQLRQNMGVMGYHLNRLDTVAGSGGARILLMVFAGLVLTVLVLLVLGVLPWDNLPLLLGACALPFFAVLWLYRRLVARFGQRFLKQMPDALDMIMRASQAGIPVSQSIRNVGLQFPAPLGPEFRRMGDSLLLGNDLEDVMQEAVLRIDLPDFSFFSVCVLLQRESGGSIVEALENLSSIIRARADLALKARALTAEGRLSGTLLSALPFAITGLLYLSNPDYIKTMFITDTGRMLLGVAGAMLVIGILSIRRIARMDI